MFGKKKKEEELPKIEEEKTEIQDAVLDIRDKKKILGFALQEYNQTYNGIFRKEDLETLDADLTSLNLLFAIYSELRVLRELQIKE